jgi:hypothetical protein
MKPSMNRLRPVVGTTGTPSRVIDKTVSVPNGSALNLQALALAFGRYASSTTGSLSENVGLAG